MGRNRQGSAKGKPRGKPRGKGRPFPPGNNANPKGRPKKDFDLVTRCRELTPSIIERYGRMGASARTSADVTAGRVVIEYGHDKPKQRSEITGADGGPVRHTYDEVRQKLEEMAAGGANAGDSDPPDEDR